MSEDDRNKGSSGAVRGGVLEELPLDRLTDAGQDLLEAVVSRAVGSLTGRATDLAGKLTSGGGSGAGVGAALAGVKGLAEGKGPLKAALGAGAGRVKDTVTDTVKQAVGGGSTKSGGKVVNIVEECDIGLPLSVTYNQWTAFEDYPSFTRKVEKVEQESEEKLRWRAQIFLSHRDWESTIVEQVPDERIVWKSSGAKGYVDGAVTFHELAPTLTRIVLVLEYYPQGFVEKTANLWRAQGRRVRLEVKHIKRHMMTRTILDQHGEQGWRGEIRDGAVVDEGDADEGSGSEQS